MKQAALPILVLLAVVTLAVVAALPSASVEADHYQKFRDGKSFYTLLSSSIETGDSLHDVEELLGPGTPMSEGVEEYRARLKDTAQWHQDLYPEGVLDSDDFVTWPAHDQPVTLQFRSGYLINHNRAEFLEYHPPYDVAGKH